MYKGLQTDTSGIQQSIRGKKWMAVCKCGSRAFVKVSRLCVKCDRLLPEMKGQQNV